MAINNSDTLRIARESALAALSDPNSELSQALDRVWEKNGKEFERAFRSYELISHLPEGDVHYARGPDDRWDVAIFEKVSTARIVTIATGMDKGVAAWFAEQLRASRGERSSWQCPSCKRVYHGPVAVCDWCPTEEKSP